jgi:hypothetical protein
MVKMQQQQHRQQWRWLLGILIICYQDCHALASSPKQVISRRNDGRTKSFSFDEPNNNKRVDSDSEVKFRLRQVGRELIQPSVALGHVQSALRSTFLPSIPSSSTKNILRSSGYLQYILFDNIQDLCTSLRSVLATQRILEGVGVGRADATALSATLNFLIRDGCGMLASLLFTSYAARSFRRNVKRWKYFADVMVDIGITLEILAPTPALKGWFLPLICLANVCKALCGVAAGACSGAFQLYWSMTLIGTQDGISEVSAKSGAQRTVMGGLGLVMSGLLAKCLGNGHVSTIVWIGLYCVLTFVHLMANWWSLKLVALDWLNSWRLNFIVDQFLRSVYGTNTGNKPHVLSNPIEVSRIEPLLFLPELKRKKTCPIEMGVSFNRFARMSHHTSASLQSVLSQKQKQHYFLSVGHAGRKRVKNKRRILVAFNSGCSNRDVAKAFLHACIVGHELASTSKEQRNDVEEIEIVKEVEVKAENKLAQLWPRFELSVSSAGWNLNRTEISSDGYEINYG